MSFDSKNVAIFSGSSHPKLAEEIAGHLGVRLGKSDLTTFPDGEISCQILDNVRGYDTFIVQSTAVDPNFFLMELLIMIDALKRASAHSIVPVIPYFGYCRQDRKDRPRVPITAKLVANMLETAGATRVLTMDLHATQVQGFFDIPVDNLHARPQLVQAVRALRLDNFVMVSPDVGSIKLARAFATQLGTEIAIVDKRRVNARQVETTTVIGDVKGRDVVLVDDMCATAGTLAEAALACLEAGALRVFAAVTHPVMVENAVQRLEESSIEKMLIANTIPIEGRCESHKMKTVSVANLFGDAIRCVVTGQSISSLFDLVKLAQ